MIRYIRLYTIILFIFVEVIFFSMAAYAKDSLYNPNDLNEQLNHQRREFWEYSFSPNYPHPHHPNLLLKTAIQKRVVSK